MANPQKENGHLDIANELVESLAKIRISGEEYQCLWVVWRKTYCWHKKEDRISLSQFALFTGLTRQAVNRALGKLSSKKIISVIKNDYTSPNSYRFNKYYNEWKPLSKKITVSSKKIRGVINIDNLVSSKMMHTKETITKETITKEKAQAPFPSPRFIHPFLQICSPELLSLWDDWVIIRKKMRVPNTDRALKLAADKLCGWGFTKAKIALENSIEKGYRGVFEPKDNDMPKEAKRSACDKPFPKDDKPRPEPTKEELKMIKESVAKVTGRA